MAKNSILRKPNLVSIGRSRINFSLLHKSLRDSYIIECINTKLFELLNPENRYTKTLIMAYIMKYKDIFMSVYNKINSFHNFYNVFEYYIRNGGTPSSSTIAYFKARLAGDEKEIILNKFRTALMEDIKCNNLVVVDSKNTVNPIDFYIDGSKDFSEPNINGIILNEEKIFVNSANLVITAFINFDYFLNHIETMIYKKHTGFDSDTYSVIYSHNNDCITMSLFSAIIKSDIRLVWTEQLMYYLSLFKTDSFNFLNTKNCNYAPFNEKDINDEVKKDIINTFYTIEKDHLKTLKIYQTNTDFKEISFKSMMRMFMHQLKDIDPVELLYIIEPNDIVTYHILKSIFTDIEVPKKYAKTSILFNTGVEEDIRLKNIKGAICAARLLPLSFIVTYLIQHGERYNTFRKIDGAIEDFVHEMKSTFFKANDGTTLLNDLHFCNDEFFASLREAFHNPMKITRTIKEAMYEFLIEKGDETKEGEV